MVARVNVSFSSSGATFASSPGILSAGNFPTPICFQYNHSNTTWYPSL